MRKRPSPLFCAFPRQAAFESDDVDECLLRCLPSSGCLAVNFRPHDGGQSGGGASSGDCVLLALSPDGRHVDAGEDDKDGWMLYAMDFQNM